VSVELNARPPEQMLVLTRLAGFLYTDNPNNPASRIGMPANVDLIPGHSLMRFGQLRGVVELPTKTRIVCGLITFLGFDQLTFYLPLTALGRHIGANPFTTEDSLVWRRPIDDWLAAFAKALYEQAPFRLAMIGFEASDFTRKPMVEVPANRYLGNVVPSGNFVTYYPATNPSLF